MTPEKQKLLDRVEDLEETVARLLTDMGDVKEISSYERRLRDIETVVGKLSKVEMP